MNNNEKWLPVGALFEVDRNCLYKAHGGYIVYTDVTGSIIYMLHIHVPGDKQKKGLTRRLGSHFDIEPYYGYCFDNYWFAWAYFQRVLQQSHDQQTQHQEIPDTAA